MSIAPDSILDQTYLVIRLSREKQPSDSRLEDDRKRLVAKPIATNAWMLDRAEIKQLDTEGEHFELD